jgi:hypothetical protein
VVDDYRRMGREGMGVGRRQTRGGNGKEKKGREKSGRMRDTSNFTNLR